MNDISIKFRQQQAPGRPDICQSVIRQKRSGHYSLVQELPLMLFYCFLVPLKWDESWLKLDFPQFDFSFTAGEKRDFYDLKM